MTPGYKTTEFWLSLLATITSAVMASGLPSDSIVIRVAGMAAALLSALGYTVMRTQLKKGTSGG